MATYVTPIWLTKMAFQSINTNGVDSSGFVSSKLIVGNNVTVRNSNPSWKIQIAKQTNASTSYSRTSFKVKSLKDGYCRARKNPQFPGDSTIVAFTKCSDFLGVSIGDTSDVSLQALASDRLKRRLREATGEARLAAPIAELNQLGRTIRAAADFTSKALAAVIEIKRKRRGRKAVRLLQDTWLNWNFGIAPLLRDINSAGQAIAKYIVRTDIKVRLYGKASRVSFGPINAAASFADGVAPIGTTAQGRFFYRKEITYKFVGAYSVKLKSSNDYTLLNHLGIDLKEVPSTLWELTALSWIADYFGNVGDYLSDVFYSPPGNLIYLDEIRTCTAWQTSEFNYVKRPGFNPPTYILEESIPGKVEFHVFEYQRTPQGTLPVTGLRIKHFDEIAPHSVSKVLNLLSLLGR